MSENDLATVSDAQLAAEIERRRILAESLQPEPDPSVPVYRVTLDVLGLNGEVASVSELIDALENLRYPDFISVAEVKRRDLPSWSDDHPMNQNATAHGAYEEWFKDVIPAWSRGDD